jgi:SSS family solute:Na+ symporter
MLITFILLVIIMGTITVIKPLREPKDMPVREDMDMKSSPIVYIVGVLVLVSVAAFYLWFV